MAGETVRTEAICLAIRPWSRTSHVVTWLTPMGRLVTVVKGAVRPKSFFLGQYDLNYTCDILYYARAKGETHALRECVPVAMRANLREDYRALALAGYFGFLAENLTPAGPEAKAWYDALAEALEDLAGGTSRGARLVQLLRFERTILRLSGLWPDFSKFDSAQEWMPFSVETGAFSQGSRRLRVSREVAACLAGDVGDEKNLQILLDAARLIGVFYSFHVDCSPDVRRTVLGMIVKTNQEGKEENES